MNFPYNLDFSKKLVIDTEKLNWQPSSKLGVERKVLERESAESGRATSIVRYAPGASFSEHTHPNGEEIFVLSGEFRDENGVYPKGTYLKSARGSRHSPSSESGCTLFVKLGHIKESNSASCVIFTDKTAWLPGLGDLKVMPLDDHLGKHTALVLWPKGARHMPHSHYGGEEMLVLEGTLHDEYGIYSSGTWIRSPHLSSHQPYTDSGCLILVSVGHL